jgi:phosphoglucosamine mutase
MARQLFGTDGIRGVAGEYPLEPGLVKAFGTALARWASEHSTEPEVVIGMDTRESGQWLAEAVAGGLARGGVKTRFAGLITTPGVAYLTRIDRFVAGVMISASHNPYQDNGLKVFDHSGFKLPDEQEHRLEGEIFKLLDSSATVDSLPLAVDEGLDAQYVDFLATTFQGSLKGMRIAIDCANGAAAHLAPELFERLGAEVYAIGCKPDGRNINLNCGALHVENVRKEVLARGADLGIAFDGDADRAMFISATGKLVDGDHVLLIVGRHLLAQGRLPGRQVVATVMSNLGLERALEQSDIRLIRTPVGDKYVLEEMVRSGAVIGGEQSGHVIFRDSATTGDGMLTAVRVLDVVTSTGKDLDELSADLHIYPQTLVNVRFKTKKPLAEMILVNREISEVEREFGNMGRVLVRFSGTEPLARVMVEGPEIGRVKDGAERIAEALRVELS